MGSRTPTRTRTGPRRVNPVHPDVIRDVDSVIASALLDGRVISEQWRDTLIRIANGDIEVEDVIAEIHAELDRTRKIG
jgi:hypothetical protein